MRPRLHLHLDDRGLSRGLVELWIPHIDPDVVWFVGPEELQPDVGRAREVVPFVPLSAADAAAAAAEEGDDEVNVLTVFCSPDLVRQAAAIGLSPGTVTIAHLVPKTADRRVAAEFSVDDQTLFDLRSAESLGFSWQIQSLPNITPRPWSVAEAG